MVMIFVNHNIDIETTNIAEMIEVPLSNVQKIKKLLCENRDQQAVISHKKVSQEGIRRVRTTELINKVQKMGMTQELQCTDVTVRTCVMKDLCCRSYRMQTCQLLSLKIKDRRLLKVHKLMSKLKHCKELEMLLFFSDQKNFFQDQIYNKQNYCWIAIRSQDVPMVMKTMFPVTVIVFGIMLSERYVMSPYVFETSLRVNTQIYMEVMETTRLPWMKEIAGDRTWVCLLPAIHCCFGVNGDTLMTLFTKIHGLPATLI